MNLNRVECLQLSRSKITKHQIDANQFKDLAAKYLQEQMIPKLLKLDLTNNSIGRSGALILSRALSSSMCRLVHLSLAGNKLGDFVIRKILEAIKTGNGCDNMMKLDLRENCLTFTSGMMESRVVDGLQSAHRVLLVMRYFWDVGAVERI